VICGIFQPTNPTIQPVTPPSCKSMA
jgi:hypothetical protein